MIDTLYKHKVKASQLKVMTELGLDKNGYAVMTLHRPANVDNPIVLKGILQVITDISRNRHLPVIFPVHPRTKKMIEKFNLNHYFTGEARTHGIITCNPLGYLEFLHLVIHSRIALTASGGIQQETTVLGIPCITMRDNTERPITCEMGTNALVGSDPAAILSATEKGLEGSSPSSKVPELWDGHAAERIIDKLRCLQI
jgi:UDP-N-acetylglucosamine 2-epimerase (non-hydrolysing)